MAPTALRPLHLCTRATARRSPRWPWIEHPGPEPAVSFEVGYWTVEDIRVRKVRDVNLEAAQGEARTAPAGRERSGRQQKARPFDLISLVTRKGGDRVAPPRGDEPADSRLAMRSPVAAE